MCLHSSAQDLSRGGCRSPTCYRWWSPHHRHPPPCRSSQCRRARPQSRSASWCWWARPHPRCMDKAAGRGGEGGARNRRGQRLRASAKMRWKMVPTMLHFDLQVCEVRKWTITGKTRGRGCGKWKVVNRWQAKWPKADIRHSSELDRTQWEKEEGRKVKRRSPAQ